MALADPGQWHQLLPRLVAELPETGGIFEIGSLVRNVLFVGRANGNLRAGLLAYLADTTKFHAIPGGIYVRYRPVDAEEEVLAHELETYRQAHGGLLPLGNRELRRAVRTLARAAA